MYYMVYVSSAISLLDQQELVAILEHSRAYNSALDITGMLLYGEGTFIQVLEGDEKRVASLFEKIRKDPRHENVSIILEGYKVDREFPAWSMAFCYLTALDKNSLAGFSEFLAGPTERETWLNPGVCQQMLIAFKNSIFNTENGGDVI